jgi:hypothetical protein
MMKTTSKWLSGLCAASALCVLTACNGGQQYTINGTVASDLLTEMEASDRVVYLIQLLDNDTINTAAIDEDGHFSLTGTVTDPNLYNLAIGEMGGVPVALEPGTIEVEIGDSEDVVTGTEANDAISEYNTLSRDLEEFYTNVLYAARDSAEAAGADVDYLSIINEYTARLTAMSDSVYEANRQNLAGVYLAIFKLQQTGSVEEARAAFADNDYVMKNPLISRLIEILEEAAQEGAQDFDPEDQGPADDAPADDALADAPTDAQ